MRNAQTKQLEYSYILYGAFDMYWYLQSTLVISKTKGLSETLRDIRTSKYQGCRSEENNKSNNHI